MGWCRAQVNAVHIHAHLVAASHNDAVGELRAWASRADAPHIGRGCQNYLCGYGKLTMHPSRQMWKALRGDKNSYASSHPWLPLDQFQPLQRQDHLVNARGRHMKIALHVLFGGWSAVYLSVKVDERQILPLFFRELNLHRGNPFSAQSD